MVYGVLDGGESSDDTLEGYELSIHFAGVSSLQDW